MNGQAGRPPAWLSDPAQVAWISAIAPLAAPHWVSVKVDKKTRERVAEVELPTFQLKHD